MRKIQKDMQPLQFFRIVIDFHLQMSLLSRLLWQATIARGPFQTSRTVETRLQSTESLRETAS